MSNLKDTPREQDRARTAVAGWRSANPGGTVEEMVGAIGGDFHKDYGPLLRGTWHLLADRGERDRQGGDGGEPGKAPPSPGDGSAR